MPIAAKAIQRKENGKKVPSLELYSLVLRIALTLTGTTLTNVFVGLVFCKADLAQNKIDF